MLCRFCVGDAIPLLPQIIIWGKLSLLSTKVLVAKAEADVYAAKMAYLIAVSDLDILIGK